MAAAAWCHPALTLVTAGKLVIGWSKQGRSRIAASLCAWCLTGEANWQVHGRVERNDTVVGGEGTAGKRDRGSEYKNSSVVAAQTVGTPHRQKGVCSLHMK